LSKPPVAIGTVAAKCAVPFEPVCANTVFFVTSVERFRSGNYPGAGCALHRVLYIVAASERHILPRRLATFEAHYYAVRNGERTIVSVIIRSAVASDLAVITLIYSHHVNHGTASFETEPPDEIEMTRRWTEVVRKGLPWLVAADGGEIAGYAYAGPYRSRLAYRHTVEDSIYVRADRLGAGLGCLLMPALITAAEECGMRQMIAVIGDSGNQASIGLHRRFGFHDAGLLKNVGFKFGRWLDTVFMQRSLEVAREQEESWQVGPETRSQIRKNVRPPFPAPISICVRPRSHRGLDRCGSSAESSTAGHSSNTPCGLLS
jgi:L-amino acid N-acyltransferase YncA